VETRGAAEAPMSRRIILIVLDSLGIGALPDAAQYNDDGADTLGHVCAAAGTGYALPALAALGLSQVGHCSPLLDPTQVRGAYGKMACASPAKDTTAGHWEIAGCILEKAFPVYPHGFPAAVIAQFEQATGTRVLGNRPASGTQIIQELGDEHCRTGCPIVYTSADSVFQIAAHEEVFGLERLYAACRAARTILTGNDQVGRVIARPFTGRSGAYVRTANRRDFSLAPFTPTVLDRLAVAGGNVTAIGKIEDIFNGRGITRSVHTVNNDAGIQALFDEIRRPAAAVPELIFANLVDFDMLWGHRRDAAGYARGLAVFDAALPRLCAELQPRDILIITADHGCDPTWQRHTDHTREYVPLLVTGPQVTAGRNLGTRTSFADIAQTIATFCNLHPLQSGVSFSGQLGIR
jgi:phosphopentomutase